MPVTTSPKELPQGTTVLSNTKRDLTSIRGFTAYYTGQNFGAQDYKGYFRGFCKGVGVLFRAQVPESLKFSKVAPKPP